MLWALGLKIFYNYIYFKPRVIGSIGKTLGDVGKAHKRNILKIMKTIKKHIQMLKILVF